jgi:hypothetical protein
MLTKIDVPRSGHTDDRTQPGDVHSVLENSDPANLIWDTVIIQSEIENHLAQFNRVAFRAAAESPCGHGIIQDALSFTSLTKEAEDFLYGIVPKE